MKTRFFWLPGFFLAMMIVFTSCPEWMDPDATDPSDSENFAIIFDANGGTFPNGLTQATMRSSTPAPVGRDYPIPTHTDLFFDAYYSMPDGEGRKLAESDFLVVESEEFTVYANWVAEANITQELNAFITNFVTPPVNGNANTNSNGNLNNIRAADGTLRLRLMGTDLIDLTWESNNPDVITIILESNNPFHTREARVTRPLNGEGNSAVTLTATVSKGDVSVTQNYTVTVLQLIDYDGIADTALNAAVAELSAHLGDVSSVFRNLVLPETATGYIPVTWASDNQSMLTNEGIVTRPPNTTPQQNTPVTLTASLVYNPAQHTGYPANEPFYDPVHREHPFDVGIRRLATEAEQDLEDVAETILWLETEETPTWGLNSVIFDLTLPADGVRGAVIDWVSSNTANLTHDGEVTRPLFDDNSAPASVTVTLTANITKNAASDSVSFQVTIPKEIDPRPAMQRAILRAQKSLGDLSTVRANITLPTNYTAAAIGSGVTVTWSTDNTALNANTGAVTRPSGANHATGVLTGRFTSLEVPRYFEDVEWRVRVMRSAATWEENLAVHYKVENGVFRNIAWSGDYYQPVLRGNAAIAGPGSGNANSYGQYVTLGTGTSTATGGYIDLGPKVGALMRLPNFTIEVLYRYPAGDNPNTTVLSFANDPPNTITNTNAGSFRGTIVYSNGGLFFRAFNAGANGGAAGSGTNNAQVVSTGNSAGIAGRVNQWVNLGLVRGTGTNIIRVQRNWTRAQNEIGTDVSRITNNAAFGSGDPEVDDLRFGWVGRSVLDQAGTAALAYFRPANTWVYEIKVWSINYALTDDLNITSPTRTTRLNELRAMNTAFGYGQTD